MKTNDSHGTMTKGQKLPRKLRKILVEKKRRERIDGCLKQIKELLFKGTEFQSDYMRMEKADILENVVQFLKSHNLHENTNTRSSTEYRQGYTQCMQEVVNVMDNVCGRSTTTLSLKHYMNNKLNNMSQHQTPSASQQNMPNMPITSFYSSHSAPLQYNMFHQMLSQQCLNSSPSDDCFNRNNNTNINNKLRNNSTSEIKGSSNSSKVLKVVPDSTSCISTSYPVDSFVHKGIISCDNVKQIIMSDRNMWRPW